MSEKLEMKIDQLLSGQKDAGNPLYDGDFEFKSSVVNMVTILGMKAEFIEENKERIIVEPSGRTLAESIEDRNQPIMIQLM